MDRDNRPLVGKRVVVTRAPDQAAELIAALERLGAQVLLLPTVEFAPPGDFAQLDAALHGLPGFDAILFVSKNALRYILARCRELQIDRQAVAAIRLLAAVGPGTAELAKDEGLRVDYVSKNQTGESLARELGSTLRGRKVLLPRSDRGDDRLPVMLREAGAEVTEVIAYRTVVPRDLDPGTVQRVRGGEVEAMVFASPSAFHNLTGTISASDLARLSERVQFAAIGPTTARALRDSGVRVEIEANESSAAALADAVAKYYQRRAAAPASARQQ